MGGGGRGEGGRGENRRSLCAEHVRRKDTLKKKKLSRTSGTNGHGIFNFSHIVTEC